MTEKELKIAATLEKALGILPDSKREYLLGYSEGVIAMAERRAMSEPPPNAQRPAS